MFKCCIGVAIVQEGPETFFGCSPAPFGRSARRARRWTAASAADSASSYRRDSRAPTPSDTGSVRRRAPARRSHRVPEHLLIALKSPEGRGLQLKGRAGCPGLRKDRVKLLEGIRKTSPRFKDRRQLAPGIDLVCAAIQRSAIDGFGFFELLGQSQVRSDREHQRSVRRVGVESDLVYLDRFKVSIEIFEQAGLFDLDPRVIAERASASEVLQGVLEPSRKRAKPARASRSPRNCRERDRRPFARRREPRSAPGTPQRVGQGDERRAERFGRAAEVSAAIASSSRPRPIERGP